jgi:hypothetical protein
MLRHYKDHDPRSMLRHYKNHDPYLTLTIRADFLWTITRAVHCGEHGIARVARRVLTLRHKEE